MMILGQKTEFTFILQNCITFGKGTVESGVRVCPGYVSPTFSGIGVVARTSP